MARYWVTAAGPLAVVRERPVSSVESVSISGATQASRFGSTRTSTWDFSTRLYGVRFLSLRFAVAFMLLIFPRTIRVYWERSCTGQAWKRSFPHASKHVFVGSFSCSPTRLHFKQAEFSTFAPADRVLTIYRALYPVKGWPDALELETFALRLQQAYGVDLRGMWRDNLTLGEVFYKITRV